MGRWKARGAVQPAQCQVALVAEKALVAAIAGQHYRHAFGSDFRDVVGRHGRGIGKGLVEMIGEVVDNGRRVGPDLEFLVLGCVAVATVRANGRSS